MILTKPFLRESWALTTRVETNKRKLDEVLKDTLLATEGSDQLEALYVREREAEGGGGFGAPGERSAEAIAADHAGGYITAEGTGGD